MLAERYANRNLARLLIPLHRYRPYPPATHRKAWGALARPLRAALIDAGERHLGQPWPALPATLFMEYGRNGNRSRYEAPHFARRQALGDMVLAECAQGRGRFLDEIINGVWTICEESFWGVPAHSGSGRIPGTPLPDTADRVIDLFAGETAGLLAWTHYLLNRPLDALSPAVCDRIRREVSQRILDPYLARDDFWWMGFRPRPANPVNNWNPWCNSNVLTAALLLEADQRRRTAIVAKVLRSLDHFLAVYHADGGCDEGPSYWSRAGGSLFDCLDQLRAASGGKIDVYDQPLIGNIGRYLYRVHIAGDWFVNFADGGPRVPIDADLVYRYGRRIRDRRLTALGASACRQDRPAGRGSLLRRLPALFNHRQMASASPTPLYARQTWLDGIQVLTARQREGTASGLYLAAKGGHNHESHNHNDVGQFVIYCDGEPLIIDIGVETYTAKTFSARRYEIWTMQSAYHNLPTINGVQQAPGRRFRADAVQAQIGRRRTVLSMDLARAYPPEANLVRWQRICALEREPQPQVTVHDRFELSAPCEVSLSLMTVRKPRIGGSGRLILPGRRPVHATFPAGALRAAVETIQITDPRLESAWGRRIYRVVLRSRRPVTGGDWQLCFRPE